ncbi:MAG: CinA family protein [Micrococcales bacterium]|nr:CinA family protein [Micrococcales bacterium]
MPEPDLPGGTAARLLAALEARGRSLAVAESLTGGAVCAALVAVPGASRVLRGAVVPYATDLKHTLLGVDADRLAASGAVHPQVARQMADGVRVALGADVGLATTGVAGPDPADGQSVGTVYVAVAGPRHAEVRTLALAGDRETIRATSVTQVLGLALELVSSDQI